MTVYGHLQLELQRTSAAACQNWLASCPTGFYGITFKEPCLRGRMLALGLDGGRVTLVDETTGEVRWRVQADSREYECAVAMLPEGRFVASVGWGDEHWTLWDASSGAAHRVGASHNGIFPCICVVILLSLSYDNDSKIS